MDQVIAIIFIAIGVGISLVAFFTVVNALFSSLVTRIEEKSDESPGRSFFLGLLNTTFIAVLSLALWSIAENSGIGILAVPSLILLALFAIGVIFGGTALVRTIGKRLYPDREERTQMLWGSLISVLACTVPYIGWFLLLPYLLLRGFGAFLMTLTAAYRARRAPAGETK
jgi:hypothetical protein